MDQIVAIQDAGTCSTPAEAPQSSWFPAAPGLTLSTYAAAFSRARGVGLSPDAEMHDWLLVINEISQEQH